MAQRLHTINKVAHPLFSPLETEKLKFITLEHMPDPSRAKPTGYTRIADVILKSNLGLEEAHMISDRFGLAPSASQGGVYFQGTCSSVESSSSEIRG
ncbi:uncharacterized protein An12g09050 [Aspergillus niger]|uniref:Contig An12c0310, genomic contig n=2 Tax=Aspergillus niger TaxID=5061 RepID=A2R0L8_ASPNC|nr:uncharacterized protein An12g09050 [Aspergillus niger]CAK46392.1 unnamed protein product [Aspergillus niger]